MRRRTRVRVERVACAQHTETFCFDALAAVRGSRYKTSRVTRYKKRAGRVTWQSMLEAITHGLKFSTASPRTHYPWSPDGPARSSTRARSPAVAAQAAAAFHRGRAVGPGRSAHRQRRLRQDRGRRERLGFLPRRPPPHLPAHRAPGGEG